MIAPTDALDARAAAGAGLGVAGHPPLINAACCIAQLGHEGLPVASLQAGQSSDWQGSIGPMQDWCGQFTQHCTLAITSCQSQVRRQHNAILCSSNDRAVLGLGVAANSPLIALCIMQLGCWDLYLQCCLKGSKKSTWQFVQASTMQGIVWLIILTTMMMHMAYIA